MKIFANNKKFWGFLALAIGLTLAFLFSGCSSSTSQVQTPEEQQREGLSYVDTVFAVGINKGFDTGRTYTEIVFSHDLYLSCEDLIVNEHRDYNHPFYVESGDLCVVRVDRQNGEWHVTLLENLSKKDLSETEVYWRSSLIDYD